MKNMPNRNQYFFWIVLVLVLLLAAPMNAAWAGTPAQTVPTARPPSSTPVIRPSVTPTATITQAAPVVPNPVVTQAASLTPIASATQLPASTTTAPIQVATDQPGFPPTNTVAAGGTTGESTAQPPAPEQGNLSPAQPNSNVSRGLMAGGLFVLIMAALWILSRGGKKKA